MSNRSYIYSVNETVDTVGAEIRRIGLSEYNYSIPLAYKILVSHNPKKSLSGIWSFEEPIAIVGDYNSGCEKLLSFLIQISKMELFEKKKLNKQIKITKKFLDSKKNKGKFIMLECGEIFEMEESEELKEQNEKLYNEEILKIDDIIEKTIIKLKELKKESKEKAMWELLGIDHWTNALYYS